MVRRKTTSDESSSRRKANLGAGRYGRKEVTRGGAEMDARFEVPNDVRHFNEEIDAALMAEDSVEYRAIIRKRKRQID